MRSLSNKPADSSLYGADVALLVTVRLWFFVAVIGQLIFAAYIFSFYWLNAVKGDFSVWTQVIPKGIIVGDSVGNSALIAHVLLAAIVTIGGLLQLIPKIRTAFPVFHRWNGRIYLSTAVVIVCSGLYMLFTRGAVGNWIQHIGNAVGGFLVIGFAVLALRNAIAGNIVVHRRWAMRLFFVVSGTWYFRVGVMGWLAIFQKPVGIDFETFTGPTLYFLAFAQYLVSLVILELYFWVKANAYSKATTTHRWLLTFLILVGSVFTAIGVYAASAGMWFLKIV